MSRDLTAGMQSAVEENVLTPAFFVELETTTGYVRVWSGIGTYEWPATSPPTLWEGVGSLGEISDMGETTDTNAIGIKLTLSGIPSDMVTAALDEIIPGKEAAVWFGLFDAAGNLVVDPYQSFAGRVDAVDMEEGGEECSITVSVESRMIDLQVSTERRWTAHDQQIDWPNDTGFDFVEQLQELNINLGVAPPIPQTQN